ncbi:uncharacterized protein LOC111619282 [Centruroides sculpturatus]|uniref:uncharacterized protein LOC111619282 n=1 Tax=Centruroides sculpturatus TaxID=218467 RepID=UPI000C6EAABA|nr:uncharacterized protein LOC111619282 [Centruroides sculpturatus]
MEAEILDSFLEQAYKIADETKGFCTKKSYKRMSTAQNVKYISGQIEKIIDLAAATIKKNCLSPSKCMDSGGGQETLSPPTSNTSRGDSTPYQKLNDILIAEATPPMPVLHPPKSSPIRSGRLEGIHDKLEDNYQKLCHMLQDVNTKLDKITESNKKIENGVEYMVDKLDLDAPITQVDGLSGKLDRLVEEGPLKEILENQISVKEKVEQLCTQNAMEIPPQKTYSAVLQSGKTINPLTRPQVLNANPEVLLLYENGEVSNCNKLRKIIHDKIKPSQLRIGVDRMRNITGGGVAIELKKLDDANKLQQYIEEQIPEISVKKPKKRLPHISIYSVPTHVSREKLPFIIYRQNDTLSTNYSEEEFCDAFRIKFSMGGKGKDYINWVIQVKPTLRKQLLMLGKASIEWSKCRVSDFCPVLQCFHCCRYGHSTKSCSQPTPTCSHCSEEHTFKQCNNKEKPAVCCNYRQEKAENTTHNAQDGSCQVYKRIKSNIIKRTEYGPTP